MKTPHSWSASPFTIHIERRRMGFFENVVDMIEISPDFRDELKNAVHTALQGGKLESIDEIRMLLEACARDHELRRRLSREFESTAALHAFDLDLTSRIENPIDDDELELIAGGDYDAAGDSWSHRAWTIFLLAAEIPDGRYHGQMSHT